MKRYDEYLVAFVLVFIFTLIGAILFDNLYARIYEAVACTGSAIMIIYLSYIHYHHDNNKEKKKHDL